MRRGLTGAAYHNTRRPTKLQPTHLSPWRKANGTAEGKNQVHFIHLGCGGPRRSTRDDFGRSWDNEGVRASHEGNANGDESSFHDERGREEIHERAWKWGLRLRCTQNRKYCRVILGGLWWNGVEAAATWGSQKVATKCGAPCCISQSMDSPRTRTTRLRESAIFFYFWQISDNDPTARTMARTRWVVVIAHLSLRSLRYHFGVDGFLARSALLSSSSSSSTFVRTSASWQHHHRRALGGKPSQTTTRMASTVEVSSSPFFLEQLGGVGGCGIVPCALIVGRKQHGR